MSPELQQSGRGRAHAAMRRAGPRSARRWRRRLCCVAGAATTACRRGGGSAHGSVDSGAAWPSPDAELGEEVEGATPHLVARVDLEGEERGGRAAPAISPSRERKEGGGGVCRRFLQKSP